MIIVIVGPTGIGKTKLSLMLAKHYNTEIISGDSVQVYKGLDIGSGKVTIDQQNEVKHHLIDILEPNEDFSVAMFQKLVRSKIRDFEDKAMTPIIVGGTGLYIKSVLYDYNFNNTYRDLEKEELYKDFSNELLHKELEKVDYESSLKIHMNNRKRVLQAILRSTSNKVSDNKNKDVKLYDFKLIGLTMDRELLYEKINQRVDQMVSDGLVEEVRNLYNKKINSNSVLAIGYKELFKHFKGEYKFLEAIDKIKQHSRNLAKKQFTFFNNQFDCQWVNVDLDNFDNTFNEVLNLLEDNKTIEIIENLDSLSVCSGDEIMHKTVFDYEGTYLEGLLIFDDDEIKAKEYTKEKQREFNELKK